MGVRAKTAGPALLPALADPDPKVRAAAAEGFAQPGMDVEGALPALRPLCKALEDTDWSVRFWSSAALRRIAEERPAAAAEAVPALVKALRSQEDSVREYAAEALGNVGPAARDAVPALEEVADKGDGWNRLRAAEALWKVAGPAGRPAVRAAPLLRDSNEQVRRGAAECLGRMGPDAAEAAPALREALADPDARVRQEAREALRKIRLGAAEPE
jgi:HEAT repeat protein